MDKGQIFVTMGTEVIPVQYVMGTSIIFSLSVARKTLKLSNDIDRCEAEIEDYKDRRQRSSKRKKGLTEHIETLQREKVLKLEEKRHGNFVTDMALYSSDIYTSNLKQLCWDDTLENDTILEARKPSSSLIVYEKCGPPFPKRRNLATTYQSKPPQCRAPSEELKAKDSVVTELVPAYYHPRAVAIYDEFKDSESIKEFGESLLATVQSLCSLKTIQKNANEYKCSSVLQVALDRFFFPLADMFAKGACLAQYPVLATRRSGGSIYTYNDYIPDRDVLHYDYKPYSLKEAIKESVCYFISAHQNNDKYTWTFGLPCTCSEMVFCMYLSGHEKAYSIELARVRIEDNDEFKNFLHIVYKAVHKYIDYPPTPQEVTFACEPMSGIILRDNFHGHDSTRVFLCDDTVYKFYNTEDPNKKFHNFPLMTKLGYFRELQLTEIGKHFHLLSYTAIHGSLVPCHRKEISSALNVIAILHQENLVHGDIREGNILFHLGNAYLIDFDFTQKCGESYPPGYNGSLSERHVGAKPNEKREFIHDYYSLISIANKYLPPSSHFKLSSKCLCSSCTSACPSPS